MSNDFQINTQFQMGSFNNSIGEFNKFFNKTNLNATKNTPDPTNFNEIFNSIAANPLQGSAQFDNVNALNLKENSKKLSSMQNTADTISKSIMNSLSEISDINKKADNDLETFASGGNISVHDVMISAQKSQMAIAMAIQLRNKALNAYNELKTINM